MTDIPTLLWQQALDRRRVIYDGDKPIKSLPPEPTVEEIRKTIIDLECDEHLRNYISKYATLPHSEGEEEREI